MPALLIGSSALPAQAGEPNVRDEAPDFEADRNAFVANRPDWLDNVSDLRGDVVIIFALDIRSMRCHRAMQAIDDDLFSQYAAGLHMYCFEVYNRPASELRAGALQRNFHHPIANGGQAYSPYNVAEGVPLAWVIGGDGRVRYCGNPREGAFNGAVRRAMTGVNYPGLGLRSVNDVLNRPARDFVDGKLSRAKTRAQEVLDELEDDADDAAQIRQQAEHLIARVDRQLARYVGAADGAFESGDYVRAKDMYERIVEAFDDELEEVVHAEEQLDTIRRDDDIEDIIDALELIEGIFRRANPRNPASRDAAIRRIQVVADDHPDDFAGERARDYVEILEPNE